MPFHFPLFITPLALFTPPFVFVAYLNSFIGSPPMHIVNLPPP